jgi:hypothetical protein
MEIANPMKVIDMGRSNRTPIAYSGEAILYEDGTINNYYGNVSVLKSLQLLSVVETKPMGFLGGGNSPKSLIREKIKDSDNEPIVSSRSLLSRVILFLGFPLLIIFLISSGIDDGREGSGFLLIPYMICAFFLVFTTDEIRNGYDENFLRFNRPIVEKYSEIEIYVAGESERFSIRLCTCQQLRWITLFRFISTFYVGTFIISFLFLGYAEIYVIDNPIIFLLVCIFWLMTSFLELNQGTFYVGGFLLWLQYPRGRENYDGIDKQFFITESSSYEFYEIALKTIEDNSNLGLKNEDDLLDLLSSNESQNLEFKGSIWTLYDKKYQRIEMQEKKSYELQDSIVKTIAGFLNTDGGTLLIGIADKPRSSGTELAEVIGIKNDLRWLPTGRMDTEGYLHVLMQILNDAFGDESTVKIYLKISFPIHGDNVVCRIDVRPLPRRINGEIYVKTKTMGTEEFFFRASDTTTHASVKSANRYIRHHFEGFSGKNNDTDI